MRTIEVHYSPAEHWFDKQHDIEGNDGLKRTVEGFYIDYIHGKSADVVFIRKVNGKYMSIMRKQKRITLDKGNAYIKICGKQYRIGCYDDESEE